MRSADKKKQTPEYANVTLRMNSSQRAVLADLTQRYATKHGVAIGAQSQVVRLLIERYGEQFAKDEGI